MTTKEAIHAMLQGEKVRETTWSSTQYMCFDGDHLKDSNGILFNDLIMSISNDWEIYEEPKPKQVVVIEKWLASAFDGYLIMEGTKEYIQDFSDTKIKLLDTYEVEL